MKSRVNVNFAFDGEDARQRQGYGNKVSTQYLRSDKDERTELRNNEVQG